MKNVFLRAIIIFSVFCGGAGAAIAQQSGTVNSGGSGNLAAMAANSKLERQIRREILTLPFYGVFDAIGFQVSGDTVTLNGFVVQPVTKKEAGEAVGDVTGVSKVVNNITVLPLSPGDDRLRAQIYRAISNEGGLYRYLLGANPPVRIIVNNGRVLLVGTVANQTDKNLAGIAANGVTGVFKVENNLQVENRPV